MTTAKERLAELENRHNAEIAKLEFLHGGLPDNNHPMWQVFQDEYESLRAEVKKEDQEEKDAKLERIQRINDVAKAMDNGGMTADDLWKCAEINAKHMRDTTQQMFSREIAADVARAALYVWFIAQGMTAPQHLLVDCIDVNAETPVSGVGGMI